MTFASAAGPPSPPATRPPSRLVPLLPKRTDSRLSASGARSPLALSVTATAGGAGTRRSMCSPTSDDAPAKRPHADRLGSGCDSNEADDETDDDRGSRLNRDAEGGRSPPRKRPKQQKWRKPTYLVRKEERDVLLGEIRALEAKVDFLRRHAGLAPATAMARAATGGPPLSLMDTELHNNLLRESMRNQQLQLLSAQSAMSELAMHSPQLCPLTTAIRLRRDWTQRREVLVALKHDKLRDAQLLLAKRSQFLEASAGDVRATSEQSHFVTARGDLCLLHFDVTPLEGVAGVREAFSVLQGYMQHVQRADSQEESSNVIHDHHSQYSTHHDGHHDGHHANGDGNRDGNRDGNCDDDDDDLRSGSILHRRVLIAGEDMPCEANLVVFSELSLAPTPPSAARPPAPPTRAVVGTMAFDFVDEDELYPYRPREFLRQDVTGAVSVSLRTRKPFDGGESESVVVLTRWVFITLHRDGLPVPTSALEAARRRVARTSDEMIDVVRGHGAPQ